MECEVGCSWGWPWDLPSVRHTGSHSAPRSPRGQIPGQQAQPPSPGTPHHSFTQSAHRQLAFVLGDGKVKAYLLTDLVP